MRTSGATGEDITLWLLDRETDYLDSQIRNPTYLDRNLMNKRDALVRAQRIAADVNADMPDADEVENFAEYIRRVHDPSYVPRSHNYGGAA